jgi:hypothetical protein
MANRNCDVLLSSDRPTAPEVRFSASDVADIVMHLHVPHERRSQPRNCWFFNAFCRAKTSIVIMDCKSKKRAEQNSARFQ